MLTNIMDMLFTLLPIFVVLILIMTLKKSRINSAKKPKTVSSDGHVIKPKDDPTCAKYGHIHEETKHRYVVHDEPVEGYVNLNGKLMSLKEAAKY